MTFITAPNLFIYAIIKLFSCPTSPNINAKKEKENKTWKKLTKKGKQHQNMKKLTKQLRKLRSRSVDRVARFAEAKLSFEKKNAQLRDWNWYKLNCSSSMMYRSKRPSCSSNNRWSICFRVSSRLKCIFDDWLKPLLSRMNYYHRIFVVLFQKQKPVLTFLIEQSHTKLNPQAMEIWLL